MSSSDTTLNDTLFSTYNSNNFNNPTKTARQVPPALIAIVCVFFVITIILAAIGIRTNLKRSSRHSSRSVDYKEVECNSDSHNAAIEINTFPPKDTIEATSLEHSSTQLICQNR